MTKLYGGEAPQMSGLMLCCPRTYCVGGVTEVKVPDLKDCGIKAVLLDLDNTLVGWQRSDMSEPVLAWLNELREAGIGLYLISNTRFGKRLVALSEQLDIPYVRRAWKPRSKGFLQAMKDLGAVPSNTVMIGDQMFTDVLGGNRLGIHTVMVKPIARREFIGTKVSRMAETVLLAWFNRRGLISIE